jgi:hypothetical protein
MPGGEEEEDLGRKKVSLNGLVHEEGTMDSILAI